MFQYILLLLSVHFNCNPNQYIFYYFKNKQTKEATCSMKRASFILSALISHTKRKQKDNIAHFILEQTRDMTDRVHTKQTKQTKQKQNKNI